MLLTVDKTNLITYSAHILTVQTPLESIHICQPPIIQLGVIEDSYNKLMHKLGDITPEEYLEALNDPSALADALELLELFGFKNTAVFLNRPQIIALLVCGNYFEDPEDSSNWIPGHLVTFTNINLKMKGA